MRRITGNSSYFDLRHNYTVEKRKTHDMLFISHYYKSHPNDNNTSYLERMRFKHLWQKYAEEINEALREIQGKDPFEVSKEVAEYMKKWQVMGHVEPFLVEFFHGIDGERFRYYDQTSVTK
ncbi:MAG: hypothetical protein NVSMB46_01950 [Candidatus Saccharimonadales bacterium]